MRSMTKIYTCLRELFSARLIKPITRVVSMVGSTSIGEYEYILLQTDEIILSQMHESDAK